MKMNNVRKEALSFLFGYLIFTIILVGLWFALPYIIQYIPTENEIVRTMINVGAPGLFLGWIVISVLALANLFNLIKGYK